jgi:hypothetical protein
LLGYFYDTVPVIGGTGPLNLGDDIPTTATFRVLLSDPVDALSLDSLVLVEVATGALFDVSASVEDETTVRLIPDAALDFLDDAADGYALAVQGGADGLLFTDGRWLDDDDAASFHTSPKTTVQISPPQGEDTLESSMSPIVFSRPMYLPSLTTEAIYAVDTTADPDEVLTATIAINIDDLHSALLIPVPTFPQEDSVTVHVTETALDARGNPLPAETTVTYASIGSAPALNARTPEEILAGSLVPGGGDVVGDQRFVLSLPVPGAHLQNRMVPATFHDGTLVITDADGCHGSAGASLAQDHEYTVGAVTFGDSVVVWAEELLRAGCDYEVRIVQSGLSNIFTAANAASDLVVDVTGETNAPVLLDTDPDDGAPAVGAGQPVVVVFNEGMDSASFGSSEVVLTGVEEVGGSIDVVDAVMTFTPSSPLEGGVLHTLVLGTALLDLASNAFGGATISFTVESDPPGIVSVTIPTLDRIEILFDEPMRADTLLPDTTASAGTIEVRLLGETVYGCLSLDGAGALLSVVPIGPLVSGTAYDVTVTTGATDLGGTALPIDVTSSVAAP